MTQAIYTAEDAQPIIQGKQKGKAQLNLGVPTPYPVIEQPSHHSSG
jgi:hypothetical protein